jgi:hypothetical protein
MMITNPVPWPNGARYPVMFMWDMDADSLLTSGASAGCRYPACHHSSWWMPGSWMCCDCPTVFLSPFSH